MLPIFRKMRWRTARDNFGNRFEQIGNQARNLDSLLINKDYLPKDRLPFLLYWISTQNSGAFNSETSYHLSKLEYNPENPEQNEIARLIAMYADNRYEEAISIRDLIKSHYPDIKVIYREVGTIGNALDGYVGVKSRPLVQTDIKNNI